MNRRSFIQAGLVLPVAGRLFAQGVQGDGWRTFEVTTRVEVLKPSGITRVSVPAGTMASMGYFQLGFGLTRSNAAVSCA